MAFFQVVRLLLLIVLAFCVYRAAAEIASWVQSALDHTDAVMRAASRIFCSSDALAQTDACRWTVAKIRAPEAHRCDPAHWTWVDSLQIVLYLWLHEARMLVAFAAAVSVDLAVSGLARFVARRTAAAPPTTLSPLRRLSRRAATILATTLSSTTVHDIDTILPHSARVRATVAAFILVFLGADITTSLERFAAFSMQRPLRTSTPHRQWDATGEVNMHNPSPSPLVMDPFHTSMGKPIIVSNAWLECELDYALRTPGLVIVSGPRAIGKSTIVRKMVKNREGMYCDVSSASTPEGLASVLEHCTTPHHLITVLWSPLANVFHVLTIPFSAWVPVNGFFSWLSILTRALQYRTPRASEADASVRAHLPSCWDDLERDDGDDDLLDYLMRTPNITIAPWSLNASGGSAKRQSRANREETAVESLPLVVVLDGIRDGQSVPLGVLEQSTPAMRFVREASRRAVVVIVAASDASLTLPALQHHEIVSVASRTTFVNAVPTSMQEAQPIYSRLAKLFEADEKLRRQRRPPPPITREHGAEATNATTAADEATALSCDMYARCAASWFAGAFEHLVSWLHLSRGSLSFEAGESGSSTPSSSSSSSTTAIEMTMAENIPSAAVCRGSADMVIHAAESLLADALMLSSPSASADESAAALGARLRTIHLAARLAASSIVSSLDALWKACRAHHEPNRTSPLRGGSDFGHRLRTDDLREVSGVGVCRVPKGCRPAGRGRVPVAKCVSSKGAHPTERMGVCCRGRPGGEGVADAPAGGDHVCGVQPAVRSAISPRAPAKGKPRRAESRWCWRRIRRRCDDGRRRRRNGERSASKQPRRRVAAQRSVCSEAAPVGRRQCAADGDSAVLQVRHCEVAVAPKQHYP
jgi:hypothetical protein